MKVKKNEVSEVLVIKLEKDEDLLEALSSIVEKENIKAGFFTGIGALNKVNMGIFVEGKYKEINMEGELEIVSLLGNVSLKDGKPFVHAHIIVSRRDGAAFGGHLLPGSIISVTCEIFLVKLKKPLERRFDEKLKLYLLNLD
ncbi:MAG: PPC domain-containing DNA-binding protein [Candidatus Baldrarchaeia archaeon]